ncbi:hypothetical protein GCM10023183_22020 [Nibribacter koreensis]|uniref:Uncharacterized protein n=1 Tax=Nibribacter koreensis TaxID=1084519 RepID=A0ABP8FLF1_9BACT
MDRGRILCPKAQMPNAQRVLPHEARLFYQVKITVSRGKGKVVELGPANKFKQALVKRKGAGEVRDPEF